MHKVTEDIHKVLFVERRAPKDAGRPWWSPREGGHWYAKLIVKATGDELEVGPYGTAEAAMLAACLSGQSELE